MRDEKIIEILRNNWTLRTVTILTVIYVVASFIFGEELAMSEIIISILVFFYFVWGFGKDLLEMEKKTRIEYKKI